MPNLMKQAQNKIAALKRKTTTFRCNVCGEYVTKRLCKNMTLTCQKCRAHKNITTFRKLTELKRELRHEN